MRENFGLPFSVFKSNDGIVTLLQKETSTQEVIESKHWQLFVLGHHFYQLEVNVAQFLVEVNCYDVHISCSASKTKYHVISSKRFISTNQTPFEKLSFVKKEQLMTPSKTLEIFFSSSFFVVFFFSLNKCCFFS